jgi:hypothetical protein
MTLEQAYATLLEKSRLRGETTEELGAGRERRETPRLHVDALEIQVDTESWIFVIDLSRTGIAFYAESPFDIGQEVTIRLGDDLSAPAKVVDSQLEGADLPPGVGHHRICCQFLDAEQGAAFVVRGKELEEAHLEGLP